MSTRFKAMLVLLLVLGVAGVTTVACTTRGTQQEQEWIETEDCDAEDWAHYEPECHRISPKPKASPRKTTAPAPAKTAAPRRTR